jgi:cellulose synthase/poly-beta-1,6-N-acetylglucosamine synthase-like glycosyltransferase
MLGTLAEVGFLLLFGVTSTFALLLMARQIVFSLIAVERTAVNPFSHAMPAAWPTVAILVAAHNEERVIASCLDHLLRLDYPRELVEIIVVNDRSKDDTGLIVDRYVAEHASVRVLHRAHDAVPGKPAAISDVLDMIRSHIVIFFDADYLPDPPLLKKLVAPFIDPQVGATMGRVVPYNSNTNLLTRLLDLERRGGYGIDQSARSILNLLPQFGGTVGGIRMAALKAAGGWSTSTLAEDTDLTYRLFIQGWSVEYVDDALCYEESPENWQVRFKQVRRWACGHNQCLFKYFWPTLTTPHQSIERRLDAAFVLMFFLFAPMSLLTLVAALIYPTLFTYPPFNFAIVGALAFVVGFGNFAPYFQMIAAVVRDRQPQAAAMLPLLFLSSSVSLLAASQGFLFALRGALFGRHLGWDKTVRFRKAPAAA